MGDVRRDRWGRYQVVAPGHDGVVGYTRATTVAKTLDDGGALIPWKATATMVGALRRPGLMARWQALHATNPDPWYADMDSKAQCKVLVEDCAQAGGTSDRSDMGTALHAVIELINRDPSAKPILQPEMLADVEAYRAAIDAAGITFDRDLIEAVVVLDEYRVAGTADMLAARIPGRAKPVCTDLKTGAELKYSWQSIAVQLAQYVHGDAVYRQGPAPDGSADERLPMPELDQEVGLVIHLPAGQAECAFYFVDLVAGWEAFLHSAWARDWRSRKDLATLWLPGVANRFTEVSGAPAQPPAFDAAPPFDSDAGAVPTSAPAPEPPSAPPAGEPATLAAVQSPDEPPPFDAPAPSASPPAPTGVVSDAAAPSWLDKLTAPGPERPALAASPDEGADLSTDDAFDALERAYAALAPDAREWAGLLARSAMHHAVSFHAKERRTLRRFEIIRGVVVLCSSDVVGPDDREDVLRSLVAIAMDSDAALFPTIEAGHALGALSAAEAATFARAVDDLVAGVLIADVDDAGTLRLRQAA